MRKYNFVAVHIQLGVVGVCRTTALLDKSGERTGEDKQLWVAAAAAVAHNQRGFGRVWVQVRVRVRMRVLLWAHSIA